MHLDKAFANAAYEAAKPYFRDLRRYSEEYRSETRFLEKTKKYREIMTNSSEFSMAKIVVDENKNHFFDDIIRDGGILKEMEGRSESAREEILNSIYKGIEDGFKEETDQAFGRVSNVAYKVKEVIGKEASKLLNDCENLETVEESLIHCGMDSIYDLDELEDALRKIREGIEYLRKDCTEPIPEKKDVWSEY